MCNKKIKKKSKIIWDRVRDVNYNGLDLFMNIYECSSCSKVYHFESVIHNFCPFCGVKYKHQVDLSI